MFAYIIVFSIKINRSNLQINMSINIKQLRSQIKFFQMENVVIQQKQEGSHCLIYKLQNLFKNQSILCIKSNTALDICVNKECQELNPFVCSDDLCECLNIHKNCIFKRVKQIIRTFQTIEKHNLQIQETINKNVDTMIDKISDFRDKLIIKLKKNPLSFYNFKSSDYVLNTFQSLQTLKGSKVSKVLDELSSKMDKNTYQQQLENIQKATNIVNDNIEQFFNQIEKQFSFPTQAMEIQTKINKAFWSPTLKGPNIVVNGPILKRDSSYNHRVALLQPSINQMCTSHISWRMRVPSQEKKSVWVAIGIGLRQKLKKNNFDFINYTRYQCDHGCYVITNNGISFTHQDHQQNQYLHQQIVFGHGEVVRIQVDLYKSTIKYFNQTSKKELIQKIIFPYQTPQDEFHICACLQGRQDEIEILSPIQTDLGKWTVEM